MHGGEVVGFTENVKDGLQCIARGNRGKMSRGCGTA